MSAMKPSDVDEFQRLAALIGQNIEKVAHSIARLAQAVENANEITVKHNQWERHETDRGSKSHD